MLKVIKLNEEAKTPTRHRPSDAGLDLYSTTDAVLYPGETTLVPTGIAVELPNKTVGKIEGRSSLALKSIGTLGGVIDEEFRGELGVMLINHSSYTVTLPKHSKIAQLLVYNILTPTPVVVGKLSETIRGGNGYGSSDR